MAFDPYAAGRAPIARVTRILCLGAGTNDSDGSHVWVELRRYSYSQHFHPLTQCSVLALSSPVQATLEFVPLCALRGLALVQHHCSAIVSEQESAAADAAHAAACVVLQLGAPVGAGRMRSTIRHAYDANPRFLVSEAERTRFPSCFQALLVIDRKQEVIDDGIL